MGSPVAQLRGVIWTSHTPARLRSGGGPGDAGTPHAIPVGSQPPLQHVPPPNDVKGSDVVHAAPLGGGGGGAPHAIPGGSQPPLQHVPPPNDVKGSGVVHAAPLGGGGGSCMPAVNVGGETATAIAITKIACVRVDSFL